MNYEIDKYLNKEINEDILKKDEPIWTKIAKIKGFEGPIFLEGVPIYFNGIIPESERGDNLGYFLNKNYEKIVAHFMPTIYLIQAKRLENELLIKGKYNSIETDLSLSEKGFEGASAIGINLIRKTYSKSSVINQAIIGEGSNELEAICDAYINFHERNK